MILDKRLTIKERQEIYKILKELNVERKNEVQKTVQKLIDFAKEY
jgi:hypothetical protein